MSPFKGLIDSAIREFSTKTCVHFKEVSGSYSGDHIRLVGGGGCGSYVGRRGGGQNVYLGRGCEYVGVIIHEMMHALGVYHEQSRPDRDRYVEILWHNIQPGKEKNFRKYGHGQLDKLGLPYDTSSIMHYDRYLFSKSQKPTIVARGRPWIKLGGQLRGSMTSNDAREVNSLFNC
ncbi:zinc metalloproteinase nas-4 [Exaiptasia diaphana]|uniref:Metalloendopeptidase n=1 Tax=Exaiptasia diaphana TaxID=2652724 RepID=A0A913XDV4_EXADI|nr:zinc metalloproteinase nas-4 [Exaiptasia diaphana]